MSGVKVLVSGASIAGPAAAHWLLRRGAEVTVVEQAPELRPGGQAVDARGVAREIIRRMGIDADVRAVLTDTAGAYTVDADGAVLETFRADDDGGDGYISEIEILRGDFSRVLYDDTREDAEYVFGDRIAELAQDEDGVDVMFASGRRRRFDLVIGADGLHSALRGMVFGPRENFVRHLGLVLAFYTVPNEFGLDRWMLDYQHEGRSAGLRPIRDASRAIAMLSFPAPDFDIDYRDIPAQKRLLREHMAGFGWETERILAHLDDAPDFYLDQVAQVVLDRWSRGRVGLLGDAAFRPRRCPAQGRGSPWWVRTCSPESSHPQAGIRRRASPPIRSACRTTSTPTRRSGDCMWRCSRRPPPRRAPILRPSPTWPRSALSSSAPSAGPLSRTTRVYPATEHRRRPRRRHSGSRRVGLTLFTIDGYGDVLAGMGGSVRVRRRGTAHRVVIGVLAVALAVGALLTAPSRGGQSASVFIRSLGRLSAVGAVDFLKGHPGDLFDYLNSRPAAVARDWSVMSAKERKSITSDTLLAGNFDGLPYAVRDAANRAQLDSDIARVQDVVLGRPGDRAARVRLAADLAIRAAVRARSSPGRYLVEYVPGATPVAAIAVGDPDTARSVTWVVPGMGTYTTDMQLWTQGAQNIWDAQGAAGAPTDRSVIAWIGYATPPVGIEAALGQYASNGAPLLTEAIEGMKAARSTDPPTLNVVAHSYGTTMAADALADTDLGVYSFVMVGSAGIEDHIPDAGALHAMHVYAGEATDDTVAQLGRASRQDPRSPAFGATVFPTDGDAALGLAPVTGHAPVLHSPWDDDIDSSDWARVPADEREAEFEAHMRQHGYLDPGTQSLEEIGMLTARAPSDPDDRLLPLHATPTGYLAAFSKAILLVPPRSALG